jgi:hypothetical protein
MELLEVQKAIRYAECPRCDRLAADYDAARCEYLRTREVLRTRGQVLSARRLDGVRIAADAARMRAEMAMIALDHHRALHHGV